MKCLVTGLCLSRNLGGPAMGLTLMEELKKKFKNIEFTFAVTATSFDSEIEWAKVYNVNIVRRDRLHIHILNKLRFLQLLRYFKYKGFRLSQYIPTRNFWSEVHREYISAIRNADLIIDMNGVSYVGDGTRNFFEGIEYYTNYYYSRKNNKPFARFIQSFGPFDDWKVRVFARNEFKYLDFIPARGKHSAEFCKQIVKEKNKVYDFPDIAILLPEASEMWRHDYFSENFLTPKGYILLSPSSVIYKISTKVGGSVGQGHVDSFILIAEELLAKGEKIVFLPHMYSENKLECDREVCRKVINGLKTKGTYVENVHLVEDNINPMEAKTIIANSKFAIVSRYHALVAAISTLTPVVSIGWNIKYKDLLNYYGMENHAIDVRSYSTKELSALVLNKIQTIDSSIATISTLNDLHKVNVNKVYEGFDLLNSWIKKSVQIEN